jgi:hypothetical protein
VPFTSAGFFFEVFLDGAELLRDGAADFFFALEDVRLTVSCERVDESCELALRSFCLAAADASPGANAAESEKTNSNPRGQGSGRSMEHQG